MMQRLKDLSSNWRALRHTVALRRKLRHYPPEVFPQEHALILASLVNGFAEQTPPNIDAAYDLAQQAVPLFEQTGDQENWAHMQVYIGQLVLEFVTDDIGTQETIAIDAFEAALTVYTETNDPLRWASIQQMLGNTYRDWRRGDAATNVERAIACYQASLQVRTRDQTPDLWAASQMCLGLAYYDRQVGDRQDNLSHSLLALRQALEVFTFEEYPDDWARGTNNLARTLADHPLGERVQLLTLALHYYDSVIAQCDPKRFPIEWADAQIGRGTILAERLGPTHHNDLLAAIVAYRHAAQIYRRKTHPIDWANIQINTGNAWHELGRQGVAGAYQKSVQAYRAALSWWTPAASADQHRFIQLNLAVSLGYLGEWADVLAACTAALTAEQHLLDLSSSLQRSDAILTQTYDAAAWAAYALLQMGQTHEALVLLEQTRQRGTTRWLALETANPELIPDQALREQFIAARTMLHTVSVTDVVEGEKARQAAQLLMESIVEQLDATITTRLFAETSITWETIQQTRVNVGVNVVYAWLWATPWGGSCCLLNTEGAIHAIPLPLLTSKLIEDLLAQDSDGGPPKFGGFGFAQNFDGADIVTVEYPGKTLRERAGQAQNRSQREGKDPVLPTILADICQVPELVALADKPLAIFSALDQLEWRPTLNRRFIQLEANRLLSALVKPLVQPLQVSPHWMGSTGMILIPCGVLAAFPLASAFMHTEPPLGFPPCSHAPSLSALQAGQRTNTGREGIWAFGNPMPTTQELPGSQREALALSYLAGQHGQEFIQSRAEKQRFFEALATAQVVSLSCHGKCDPHAIFASYLRLANRERVRLDEISAARASSRGVRLVMLSACQTAMADMRGARDEVRSLATAFLAAGIAAVLGAYWPVDDMATLTLMVRFAEVWWPVRNAEPPAPALRKAQQWLREITQPDLTSWWSQFPEQMRPDPNEGSHIRRILRHEDGLSEPQVALLLPGERDRTDHTHPYADPYYWAGWTIIGW